MTIEGSYLSQRPQGDACRIVIDVIGAGFSGGQSQAEVRGRMVLRQGCIALSAGDPVSGEVLASNIRMRRINLEGGIRGTVYTARVAGTLADDGTLTAGGGRPNGRIVVVGDVLEP